MTTVNFAGLAAGTKLDDQLVGLKFLKYGPVGGIVVDSLWGRVASFDLDPNRHNDQSSCVAPESENQPALITAPRRKKQRA